jgi:hypothetical protein
MRAPARVSLVLSESIQLDDVSESDLQALRAEGLEPSGNQFVGWSLKLPPNALSVLESAEGQRVLMALARAGLAFLYDPRQGWSPADLMDELVARGVYADGFSVCAFDGENWQITCR